MLKLWNFCMKSTIPHGTHNTKSSRGDFLERSQLFSCRKHNSFKKGAAKSLWEGHFALVHFYSSNISSVMALREKLISASLETSCLFSLFNPITRGIFCKIKYEKVSWNGDPPPHFTFYWFYKLTPPPSLCFRDLAVWNKACKLVLHFGAER